MFDFVTNAGSKLGGKIYDIVNDDIDVTAPVEVSQERINELRAKSITDNVNESDVIVQGFGVVVDGDRATLTGKVNTQTCSEEITLLAGNQHGIGSVDCQLEVATPTPESSFYTVASGDTLGKIAAAHYGSAGSYMKIFEANRSVLDDPNKIYPGQKLRIPSA
ncbi:UNVERIFIED_CONTAM: hypothetical protein GTU68_007391 [Idotea baltica]|nr:hypothetical protein [Idotea baltica]